MAQLGSVPSWGDGGRGFRSRCSEREWEIVTCVIGQRISVNFRLRWEESEQLDSKQ
uniref:ORF55f n=1 Tax=Pinus koraiensis TaxID=88728 RepID=A4QME5_PINKO|nr:ORF55f [Pinus koraiensis]ABP35482.1 ORF55f [Pinus koraiensis]